MPRTSFGTYTAPANTSAVSSQPISSTAFNTLESDIGTEITNSLDRLGRGGMQAALNMGGFAVNNQADPVLAQDGATKNYVINYVTGTANLLPNSSLAQAPAGSLKGVAAASPASTATVTITIASPGVVTWTGHGLTGNAGVIFTTSGALPSGLVAGTLYYIVGGSVTTNTFSVSAIPGGTAINTTGSQSGTHTGSAYTSANEQDLSLQSIGTQITKYISLTPFVSSLSIANDGVSPNTKFNITAASANIMSASGGNAQHTSIAVSVISTTTGANALDTGSVAAFTWYNVFLISNGTTCSGLLSLSATAPTLPTGYTYFLRVGAVRTDGSNNFFRIIQKGQLGQFAVTAATNTAALPILVTGTAGSLIGPSWVAVSLTGNIPATSSRFRGIAHAGLGGQIMIAPNNAYGAYNNTSNPPPVLINAGGLSINSSTPFEFAIESSNIYWAASGGVLLIFGWIDTVPAT